MGAHAHTAEGWKEERVWGHRKQLPQSTTPWSLTKAGVKEESFIARHRCREVTGQLAPAPWLMRMCTQHSSRTEVSGGETGGLDPHTPFHVGFGDQTWVLSLLCAKRYTG